MSPTIQPCESTLQVVKDAMIEYYTLLCRMPHMNPDCLRIPPAEGWSGSHAEDLKRHGWSDGAAEFVRHLPYIAPGMDAEHAWITWATTAIPFDQPLSRNLPRTWSTERPSPPYLPPHVVYLGQGHFEASSYLLLDTQLGHIISYSNNGEQHLLSYEEYNALPNEQKWMAHTTLPAKTFFEKETTRLKHLVYIPVPFHHGPKFYLRAETHQAETELLAIEDEYEADHEIDSDYYPSEDSEVLDDADLEELRLSSAGEDETEDEAEDVVSKAEIAWLRIDAEHGEYQPSAPLHRWQATPLPSRTVKVYEIYKRNAWPYDHFNAGKCRTELAALQEEWEQQQKEKSDAARQKKREDYLKRLTPEQLKQIEEKKNLAEQTKP